MTVSKVASALVVSAEMHGAAAQSSTPYGGLWVGGRVTLSDTSLSFAANGMNRALQTGVEPITLPLRDVDSVDVLPAFFTKIIAVGMARGTLKLRCFGAPAFAEAIRAAVRASGGWSL